MQRANIGGVECQEERRVGREEGKEGSAGRPLSHFKQEEYHDKEEKEVDLFEEVEQVLSLPEDAQRDPPKHPQTKHEVS